MVHTINVITWDVTFFVQAVDQSPRTSTFSCWASKKRCQGGLLGHLSEFQNVPCQCSRIVSSVLYALSSELLEIHLSILLFVAISFECCRYFLAYRCPLLKFTLAGPQVTFLAYLHSGQGLSVSTAQVLSLCV